MRKNIIKLIFILILALTPLASINAKEELQNTKINLLYEDRKYTLDFSKNENWINRYKKYFYNNIEIKLPATTDNTTKYIIKNFLEERYVWGIDNIELTKYIKENIEPDIKTTKSDVKILKDENGKIIFDGVGLDGIDIDIDKTLELIRYSIANASIDIRIPIKTTKSNIKIEDESLQALGFKDIISVGKSTFYGSTRSRIHNIKTGSNKLGGKIIMPNEEYSIAENIGPVNGYTGYKSELVIKGSKTIPEYGGGLCQVSSTLYRGALRAGLPITERINHSYAVSYYEPWGTDATIYPPSVDLKFINNTGSPILIQNYMIEDEKKLFFVFYGTDDGRETELFGPYITNTVGAPATKIEYTDALAPGQKKVFGNAVNGFDARWYRYVYDKDGNNLISEEIFSKYQARPYYYAVGIEPEDSEPPNI